MQAYVSRTLLLQVTVEKSVAQLTQQLQGDIASLVTRIEVVEVTSAVRVEALQRTVTVRLRETVQVVDALQDQLVASALESGRPNQK